MDSTIEKSENLIVNPIIWEQEDTHNNNIDPTLGTGEYP